MHRLLQTGRDFLLDFLYPPRCGICGAGGDFLCQSCRRRLPVAAPPRCRRCWALTTRPVCGACTRSPLDGARAAFAFEAGAQTLVHELKYRSLSALAKPMGDLLTETLQTDPLPVDLIVPVPLHARRQRQRGFNQSELLARAVAERASLELDVRSLRRVRSTPQQTHADRERRQENVRGAFRCAEQVDGRRVLLIDDVQTTGATLQECARSLRAAGATSVWALTFCRADAAGDIPAQPAPARQPEESERSWPLLRPNRR